MFADTLPVDAVWSLLCAMTVAPLGFMLGSSCSPCCGGCRVADGKPRTDPATEGHWVPSGTWASGVTWTFSSSPSTTDGGTWFFYSSMATSKPGGGASKAEQQDWGNICNWYSNKTTTPSVGGSSTTLDKRATRLPPEDAIVHIYSSVNTTTTGPITVKNAYFWGGDFGDTSEITTTSAAHDSVGGSVFNGYSRIFSSSTVNGGATFNDSSENYYGTVNGGATFNDYSLNSSSSTVNGGATFNDSSWNARGTVNNGATFNGSSRNFYGTVNGGAAFDGFSTNHSGTVNDGATFNGSSRNFAAVNGGATFNDSSGNSNGTVNGGATFNDNSGNISFGTVNDGATFNDNSLNSYSTVNGGATFNGLSTNQASGTVNDGATFNDAACSFRVIGSYSNCPFTNKRIFVAHPTDLPTCNGTAPDGCASILDTCGCG